ncbi:MAG: hypothetical protein B0D84_00220, partial [Candidatus Sedimenticola endophacoides]
TMTVYLSVAQPPQGATGRSAIEAQLAAAGFTRVVGFEAALRAFPAILDGLLELGLLWMRGGPGHWLDYPMLRQVEALLSDCQSTGLLERVVRFRERPRVSSYISPDGRQAYFPDDIDLFRGIDALRMADCGGYDGDTLLQVARLAGNRLPGLEYVISFEPDPENYRRLAQAAGEARERWPRARFIASPLGVWSETTLLNFDAAGSSSSALSGQGATRVPVVALDAMLGGARPNYIKMDIEGAEGEALHGARRLIAGQAPVLAICLYHRPHDLWEIPLLVRRLQPAYRFYLRTHGHMCLDTVLYCVPER